MRLAVSPCSTPDLTLEEALEAFGEIGFRRFEMFTGWAKSAISVGDEPEPVRHLLDRYGFRLSSMHLPSLAEDLEASLEEAVRTCHLASELDCPVVLFKAEARDQFRQAGKEFLDRIESFGVTPVLQNHRGTAISTIEDYREVLEAVDDERLKCLLEVGHFHSVGVDWREGYEFLEGRIACVHIKDQIGAQSVPFGTGEIDLPGLFERLKDDGYEGDVVVEMEVEDKKNTLRYLGDAYQYVKEHAPWICPE